jgi:hypothetical protein
MHTDRFVVTLLIGQKAGALRCSVCTENRDYGKNVVGTWTGETNLARLTSLAQAHWAQTHSEGTP